MPDPVTPTDEDREKARQLLLNEQACGTANDPACDACGLCDAIAQALAERGAAAYQAGKEAGAEAGRRIDVKTLEQMRAEDEKAWPKGKAGCPNCHGEGSWWNWIEHDGIEHPGARIRCQCVEPLPEVK